MALQTRSLYTILASEWPEIAGALTRQEVKDCSITLSLITGSSIVKYVFGPGDDDMVVFHKGRVVSSKFDVSTSGLMMKCDGLYFPEVTIDIP